MVGKMVAGTLADMVDKAGNTVDFSRKTPMD